MKKVLQDAWSEVLGPILWVAFLNWYVVVFGLFIAAVYVIVT